MKQHQPARDGEPSGVDRVQGEMKQIEDGLRHETLQCPFVRPDDADRGCARQRIDNHHERHRLRRRREQSRPRRFETAPFDGVDCDPHDARRGKCRHEKRQRRHERCARHQPADRNPQHGPGDHDHSKQGSRRNNEWSRPVRACAPFDERAHAQQERRGQHGDRHRADDVFPAIARRGEIGRHDFRLEQGAAVARRDHEHVMRPAGRPIGRRDLCPHGDGNERGRDDERVRRSWRRRRRAKRLLDDDGRDARDGFDADEPRTQRARRDEERCPGGFGVDALFWQIGDAAGPRHRSAVGVVHGDAGVGAAFGR